MKQQKHEMLSLHQDGFRVCGELISAITVVNFFKCGPYFIMFDVSQ